MRIPALPDALDSYVGWEPLSSKPRIAKVSSDISPLDMWTHFISQRRPVIIDGHLTDSEWNGSKWTDLEYLKQTAGKVPVKIEPIHPSAGHFGTSAKRKRVAFSDYVDLLQETEGAGKWYLTTQYIDDEESDTQKVASKSPPSLSDESDVEPEQDTVLPSPTNALSNDFPTTPELLGSLVLQQCNLWLGNSKEGKSSGLHHDFHDNLYILLSGYKRFLLFPPSAHRYLHPRGLVDRVHPNGLIVYAPPGQLPTYVPGVKSQMPIRPDGLVPSDAARWRRKARLRVKVNIDEQAATEAGEGPRDKLHRKGKAKQTRAQEIAERVLQQAETELRLCRMDEEGLEPEMDTSYEDDSDESNSSGSQAIDGTPSFFTSNVTSSDEDSDSDPDSSDSDSDGDQLRSLLATLPDEMKPIAMRALQGDDPLAAQALREYIASLDDAATEGESDEEELADVENSPRNLGRDACNQAAAEQIFEDECESIESGESDSAESDLVEDMAIQSRSSRKRNIETMLVSSGSGNESDLRENHRPSKTKAKPNKTVKIAPNADQVHVIGDPEEVFSEPEAAEEDSDEDDSDDSESTGMPLFPEGDSGSEFGDIDAGEAELETFLAASGATKVDATGDSEEEDDEPSSFSQIPPSVLHEYFGISDDFSQPIDKDKRSDRRSTLSTSSEVPQPLSGCPRPLEVYLLPGQMLYLPASWYHEVTSSSSPPHHLHSKQGDSQHKPSNVHMALNYWFHPPDALDFEPVETVPSSSAGQNGDIKEPNVPGVGANIGQSAIENLRSGTGSHERPYRDAEVWDEVARAVDEQVGTARQEASKWATPP